MSTSGIEMFRGLQQMWLDDRTCICMFFVCMHTMRDSCNVVIRK